MQQCSYSEFNSQEVQLYLDATLKWQIFSFIDGEPVFTDNMNSTLYIEQRFGINASSQTFSFYMYLSFSHILSAKFLALRLWRNEASG